MSNSERKGINDLPAARFRIGQRVRTEVGEGVITRVAGGGRTDHFGVSAPREYAVKLNSDAKYGFGGQETNFDENDIHLDKAWTMNPITKIPGVTRTLCLDVGGVLSDKDMEDDYSHIQPIDGCGEFLRALKDGGLTLIVNSAHPAVEVKGWLQSHNLIQYVDSVVDRKPIAEKYLDDRMVRFKGDYEEAEEKLLTFVPWWFKGKEDDYKIDTLSVDFDGTLNTYGMPGTDDEYIADDLLEPQKGAADFIKRLKPKVGQISVFTARPNLNMVRDWVEKNGLSGYIDGIEISKMRTKVYLDDRGMRFKGDYAATLEKLRLVEPEEKGLADDSNVIRAEREWKEAKAAYSKLHTAKVGGMQLEVAQHLIDEKYHALKEAIKQSKSLAAGSSDAKAGDYKPKPQVCRQCGKQRQICQQCHRCNNCGHLPSCNNRAWGTSNEGSKGMTVAGGVLGVIDPPGNSTATARAYFEPQVTNEKGHNPVKELQAIGKELEENTDPAPMPGYGQIFIKENGSGEAWYVGGDGDENGFGDLMKQKLTAVKGIDDVTYEAEAFPPKDEGWLQVYPKQMPWISKSDGYGGSNLEDGDEVAQIDKGGTPNGRESLRQIEGYVNSDDREISRMANAATENGTDTADEKYGPFKNGQHPKESAWRRVYAEATKNTWEGLIDSWLSHHKAPVDPRPFDGVPEQFDADPEPRPPMYANGWATPEVETVDKYVERCYACGKPIPASSTGKYSVAVKGEKPNAGGYWVGPDCYKKIIASGDTGYQPPSGGPLLVALNKWDKVAKLISGPEAPGPAPIRWEGDVDEQKEAYRAGFISGHNHKRPDDNPHNDGTPEFIGWSAGWQDGNQGSAPQVKVHRAMLKGLRVIINDQNEAAFKQECRENGISVKLRNRMPGIGAIEYESNDRGANSVKMVHIAEKYKSISKDGQEYPQPTAEGEVDQEYYPGLPPSEGSSVYLLNQPKPDEFGYGPGYKSLTPDELERAKRVDLITLPPDVTGTNCGNCKWFDQGYTRSTPKQMIDAQCEHPKIKLPVTDRMCCAEWDNDQVEREWEKGHKSLSWGQVKRLAKATGGLAVRKVGHVEHRADGWYYVIPPSRESGPYSQQATAEGMLFREQPERIRSLDKGGGTIMPEGLVHSGIEHDGGTA